MDTPFSVTDWVCCEEASHRAEPNTIRISITNNTSATLESRLRGNFDLLTLISRVCWVDFPLLNRLTLDGCVASINISPIRAE